MTQGPPKTAPLALPAERLKVGMVLPFTLMDASGRLLLAKGQRIADQQQLQSLHERHQVFVPHEESDQALKAWLVGFHEAERCDAALKDLDQFVRFEGARTEPVLQGTLNHQCDELMIRLRRLLIGMAHGRLSGIPARDGCADLYAHIQQMTSKQVNAEGATMLLTYRACSSPSEYSVLHALQCAILAQRLYPALGLDARAGRSLVLATATMNVAMVEAQDELARQKSAPSLTQRQTINEHAEVGAQWLERAGVDDADWLASVRLHHSPLPEGDLSQQPMHVRMARIIHGLDRYTATMSPRASRAGRTSQDAARAVIVRSSSQPQDPVGVALLQLLGLYPPGTFVQLKTGETGLVLRPGASARTPVMALVVNRAGEPLGTPKLADARLAQYTPAAGVPGSSVRARIHLDHIIEMLNFSRTPAANIP